MKEGSQAKAVLMLPHLSFRIFLPIQKWNLLHHGRIQVESTCDLPILLLYYLGLQNGKIGGGGGEKKLY